MTFNDGGRGGSRCPDAKLKSSISNLSHGEIMAEDKTKEEILDFLKEARNNLRNAQKRALRGDEYYDLYYDIDDVLTMLNYIIEKLEEEEKEEEEEEYEEEEEEVGLRGIIWEEEEEEEEKEEEEWEEEEWS